MTLVSTIIERAKKYPERPAIVSADDGTAMLYGDLVKTLAYPAQPQMTSGTTGSPKKIVITEDNLARRLERVDRLRGPAFVSMMSLFVGAIPEWVPFGTQLKFHMLLKGGTIFTSTGEFNPLKWLGTCEEHKVEAAIFLPKIPWFWKLLDADHSYRFQHVFLGGATVSVGDLSVLKNKLGADLRVNYSVTEVGPIAGGSFDEVKDIAGCVGRVDPAVDVEIERNQVRVRCDTMVPGYEDDPDLTAQKFRDGWFYPGDLGHFENGMLVIDGRAF